MADAELKDYPATLRKNVAAARLAKALHDCWCEAYAVPFQGWEDLPLDMRHGFMREATLAIERGYRAAFFVVKS